MLVREVRSCHLQSIANLLSQCLYSSMGDYDETSALRSAASGVRPPSSVDTPSPPCSVAVNNEDFLFFVDCKSSTAVEVTSVCRKASTDPRPVSLTKLYILGVVSVSSIRYSTCYSAGLRFVRRLLALEWICSLDRLQLVTSPSCLPLAHQLNSSIGN